METKFLTPILNVSNINESFTWFEKLGWKPSFKWGDPTGFGGVVNGDVEIFMCQDAQGGRGKGPHASTFGPDGNEASNPSEATYQLPVFSILDQGSAGAFESPFCSNSNEIPSGERTKAM